MNKAAKKIRKGDDAKARAQKNVNSYRARMKRQGFRLMQIWVPDVNSPGFAKEFARQTLVGTLTDEEAALMDSALSDVLPGWEP